MHTTPLQPARLLIVDDEPAQLRALTDTLSIEGFTVIGCADGHSALAALQLNAFDILLTDLQMDGMDGVALMQAALAIDADLVPVLMTAHSSIDVAIQAMRAGAFDFLPKPFRLSALRPVLARAVEVRRLRQQARALQERVEQHALQLEAANRELDVFAARVAHDLRSPIQNMVGFARLLLQAESHPEPEAVAQRILNAGRRAETLIDDLLSFARLGEASLVKGQVDLGLVVQRARQSLVAPNPGRQVQWQIDALPTVSGDASLLEQVFVNLLGNALKFSAGRDPARIEVGARPLAAGGYEIWVRDNGVGFDPAYADGLFTPFHRLHSLREFPGTGMGLANVRRIVERHGGQVAAEGLPGRGASFTLSLPGLRLCRAASGAAAALPCPDGRPSNCTSVAAARTVCLARLRPPRCGRRSAGKSAPCSAHSSAPEAATLASN